MKGNRYFIRGTCSNLSQLPDNPPFYEHSSFSHRIGSWVKQVAFNPEELQLAAISDKSPFVRLWGEEGEGERTDLRVETVPGARVETVPTAIAFSSKGLLAAALETGRILRWEIADNKARLIPPLDFPSRYVNGIVFNPSNENLAAETTTPLKHYSVNRTVSLWNQMSRRDVVIQDQQIAGGFTQPSTIAYSSIGIVAVGLIKPNQGGVARITEDGELLPFLLTSSRVNSLAFNQKDELAAGLENGTLIIWDEYGSELSINAGSTINSIAFGPGGLLATGLSTGTVIIWDSEWNQLQRLPNPVTRGSSVTSVSFSRTGSLAAGFSDGGISVWKSQWRHWWTPKGPFIANYFA